MSPAERRPSKTMRGHTGQVRGVVHLSCGRRIITCSTDGSLRQWDLKSGAQIGEDWRDEGAGILSIALSPNGMTIASGNRDRTVSVWDIGKGKVIAKWRGHTRAVRSVGWSPGGERVVSGGWDGTARVWDVKSGRNKDVLCLNPIETGQEPVLAVSYSPKGTRIATGGDAYSGIKIWDAKTGKLLHTVDVQPFGVAVWSLTWTSDSKKLIAGSGKGSIMIFNTATWQSIHPGDGYYRHHRQLVRAIIVSPNGRLAVSTSSDGTACLLNLNTNRPVCPLLQHKSDVKCAAFSADGKLLSTACADENAYVWDIQAIFKAAGLEDLLSIPDAQKSELKKKPLAGADTTRRPAPHHLPGFFDDVQDRGPPDPDPDLHRRRSAFAPSWGSRPRALLARLPQFFRRSQSNADKSIELQKCPGPSTSSRHSPPVVKVPALDDKKALYTARRPERASDKAKRIKNPAWWARVVLFLCCASPTTDDSH